MDGSKFLKLETVPDSGSRYDLGKCIGIGVCGTVYEATDTQGGNKKVAVKVQRLSPEYEGYIQEEYRILKDFSSHSNLPDFYGVYKKTDNDGRTDIWFVMELCEAGSIMDIVRNFQENNRRMAEEHIAFILKETIKALVYLHKNHIIHRDIRGNNILLTKDGEIKLVDFGFARELKSTLGKCGTCIGSVCWMAPEVVTSAQGDSDNNYGSRADVWAVGITAIELADGKPPFDGIHPTRVIFQIARNPPPGLSQPGNWSEAYNDFISECLEKNPEYRPFMEELLQHPFLTAVPENCYFLTQELKKISEDFGNSGEKTLQQEVTIKTNFMKVGQHLEPEQMYFEDLAAMENVNEELILSELQGRMSLGYFHTFVGDVLLILNPNELQDIYDDKYHHKYNCKSRSDNPPHVYAVADRAYQDALHHEISQYILLSGESGSGKTTALNHLIDHFLFMGKSKNLNGNYVRDSMDILEAFITASTPVNYNSTRCILRTQITFGATGKISGALFNVYQLEKWRISSTDMLQSNFHILYYFYDAMYFSGQLNIYLLNPERNYRYLKISKDMSYLNEETNNPNENVKKFNDITSKLKEFDFNEDMLDILCKMLAAILNLGEICFEENEENIAEIENLETCAKVAELLNIDEKKFVWALTNYCLIDRGIAISRKSTCNQARDARDMLANCLYARLVDWVVNILNGKMAKTKALFGEKYSVIIFDLFGFECFERNDLEQLIVNSINEQMQYHYIQRVFAWETLEQLQEDITPAPLNYYDNKWAIDQLLGKPAGILSLIDEASKTGHNFKHVLDAMEKSKKGHFIKTNDTKEFIFSHYTGKVTYDIKEMLQKNRDFLPPEMIETLRMSKNTVIREFFVNKLTKTGNIFYDIPREIKNKWENALMLKQEKEKRPFDERQYSQTKKMRTAITIFRNISLDILRELSVGGGSGGTHFIRCIRTDLKSTPRGFHEELIKQQLRALSVLDTISARQLGYPHRISFSEFLRRYKFLAFDFDENVEVTKENCRLLLVRLKMKGWIIGKSKVFLTYYNEEYLSRLYETQVKKIIKIQSMMRAFLAKRNVATKLKNMRKKSGVKLNKQESSDIPAEAAAALMIQKAYRGYNVRKKYGPLISKESGQLDSETAKFILPFWKKWKNKSLFQVLLHYRSAKFQDLINLSQQIHIFNQNMMHELQQNQDGIDIERVNPSAKSDIWLGEKRPSVWKLPFRFDELPFYDTEYLCDTSATADDDQETWDSPLQWRQSIINEMKRTDYNRAIARSPMPVKQTTINKNLIEMPYTRDPSTSIDKLPPLELETDQNGSSNKDNISDESENSLTKSPKISVIKKTASPNCNALDNMKKPVTQVPLKQRTDSNSTDKNFEGANQDFEFIRVPMKPIITSKLKRPPGNPIAELEYIGRKHQEKNSDDDPPFNFQGMLRKTNYQRNSLKKNTGTTSPLPELLYSKVLKYKANTNMEVNNVDDVETEEENFKKLSLENATDENENNMTTELAPGIILKGIATDL